MSEGLSSNDVWCITEDRWGRVYAGAVNEAMAGFLGTSAQQNAFAGTLGFDTVSGATATFPDAINLNNFTNEGFIGLGSATSAILSGPISLPADFGGTGAGPTRSAAAAAR